MYIVSKVNKRICILDEENMKVIYFPPNFIKDKINSRKQLHVLCDQFNELQQREIDYIVEFEKQFIKESSNKG